MPDIIKQIEINGATYDISAMSIQDSSGNAKTWQDILNLIDQGFSIEVPWTQADYTSSTTPSASKLATIPAGVVVQYNSGQGTATGTLTASADTSGKFYFVYDYHDGKDTFDEYVTYKSGNDYLWEKIGNTDIDLSNYVQKGTYTTGTPSSDATGSAGAGTYTTSSAGSGTATGTATVTYDKATGTGNAGGVTINGSNFTFNGTAKTLSQAIDYTPEGSVSVNAVSTHSHTLNVTALTAGDTVTVLTGVKASGTTAVVDSVSADGTATVATEGIKSVGLTASTTTSEGAITYTEGITGSAPALTGTKTFVTGYPNFSGGSKAADTFTPNTPTTLDLTKFSGGTFSQGTKASLSYTATQNVMYSATVNSGVLSWSTTTLDHITNWSANGTDSFTAAKLNTGFYSAGSAASFAEGAFTAAALGTASTASVGISGGSYSGTTKYLKPSTTAAGTTSVLTGITSSTTSVVTGVASNGTATVIKQLPTMTISSVNASAITGTFTGTSATINVSINYTPAGTIGGSQTVAAHSHSVTNTSTTVDVPIGVAVPNHTHEVTISGHTHTLNNHTHNITFQ